MTLERFTYTSAQARGVIGVGRTKFYELISDGELHPINNGTALKPYYKFSEEDLAAYLERRRLSDLEERGYPA